MYRQIRWLGLACGAALAMTGSASAQVIPMSFTDIVEAADIIVVAEAIDSRSEWIANGTNRAIVTRVTFRVSDTYKGLDRLLLPLEFLGGTVDGTTMEVSGVPTFELGDRAVLFVSGERAISPVVGHFQGEFPINTAPDGTDYVTLHDHRAFSTVGQIGATIRVSPVAIPTMSLTDFREAINNVTQ